MRRTANLAETWQSYRDQVIPAAASPVQVQECRRAFYAGAAGFYSAGSTLAVDGAEDPIETLRAELDAFDADVRAGKA